MHWHALYKRNPQCISSFVRRLADYLSADKTREKEKQFFPLYHENDSDLEALSSIKGLAVGQSMNQTLQNAHESLRAQFVRIPNSTFPSDEFLLYRNNSTCRTTTTELRFSLPSTSVIEYALGLAMHTYFVTRNSSSALQLLSTAIRVVYNNSLCASSPDFRVPVDVMERISVHAQGNVDAVPLSIDKIAISQSFPKLGDVAWVVKVPHSYFFDIIKELSSIRSQGLIRLVQSDGRGIWLADIRQMLFAVSLHSYLERLQHLRSILGTGDLTHSTARMGTGALCDDGYEYVNRVRQGNFMQNCCLSACARIDSVLFRLSITREACCEACNMGNCGSEEAARSFARSGTMEGYETVVI